MSSDSFKVPRGAHAMPETLFGYEVIDRIGQGAATHIYAACQAGGNQLVALKYLVRRPGDDDRFLQQLRTELEVAQHLAHPGLRKIFDLQINHDWLRRFTDAALVMELFDGVALDEQPPRPGEPTLDCFIQCANILHTMHRAGFVHCDIKPNNILLNARGQVKIIDLGQTCALGEKKRRMQGTPDFMAPEQVRCQAVSPQTDIFNLGATLYWILGHRKLPTLLTATRKPDSFLLSDTIASPHELDPSVPQNLSNLVMDCVRLEPKRRPADMVELAQRLETIRFSLRSRPPRDVPLSAAAWRE